MNKELNCFSFNKSIKYQKSDAKVNWHKFHILLDADEYEFFLDLRKFFKRSVSAIVSYAVKKYYKEMIKFKNTDNYLFKNYVIIKKIIDSVVTWKICWGYTEKMMEAIYTQL